MSEEKEVVWVEGGGVPVYETQFLEVTGLPEQQGGVLLLISRMVLTALPERLDLVCPGELVRDKDGKPCGCKGLTR